MISRIIPPAPEPYRRFISIKDAMDAIRFDLVCAEYFKKNPKTGQFLQRGLKPERV